MDMEANEKSMAKNSRLDELEKGERASIRDEDKGDEQYRFNDRDGENKKKEETAKGEQMKDDKIGNRIDVFK
jgi:hypothetical protein